MIVQEDILSECDSKLFSILEKRGESWAVFGSMAGRFYGLKRIAADIDIIVDFPAKPIILELGYQMVADNFFVNRQTEIYLGPLRLKESGFIFSLDAQAQSRTLTKKLFDTDLRILSIEDWLALKLLLFRNSPLKNDLADAQEVVAATSQEIDKDYLLWRLEEGELPSWESLSRISLLSKRQDVC